MNHARSGELSGELGHDGPNANEARTERAATLWAGSDSLLSLVESATRHASHARPRRFGWPPDRGPFISALSP